MGYGSRLPTDNYPPTPGASPWGAGASDVMDDVAILISQSGCRCIGCDRVTFHRYLKDDKCPDCRPNDPKPGLFERPAGFGSPEGGYEQSDAD